MADSNPRITLDYSNCLAAVMKSDHGLVEAEIDELARETPAIAARLAAQREAGDLPYRDLPYRRHGADEIEAYVAELDREGITFDDVVVLGIGGSALGTTAVLTACAKPYYNLLSRSERGGPRLLVMDNVDPAQVAALLAMVDPARSLFIVISKSGSTAETMAQFLICRDMLRQKLDADAVNRNIVVITDREKGSLRPIAGRDGFRTFDVPDGVGGRFSVLSPVGLLPLALVGVDIRGLLAGAAAMDERCNVPDLRRNPAFMSAAIQMLFYGKGKPLSVMMPYSQALRDVADWYRQLWAESLGKPRMTPSGGIEYVGPTPIKALGVTDQHSQVQLYREGPNDKIFTLLAVEDFGTDVPIPAVPQEVEGVNYLGGHTMGELMNAERRATTYALWKSQRPSVTITLPEVSAHTVGQLLYMLEVQTSFAGELLRVNAYNQEGVEEGKRATYALMGRKGFEDLKTEIESQQPSDEFII